MRVISGKARGLKLNTPKNEDVRPTTDRVKESLFNIINFYVMDNNILDLFAGTGSLGQVDFSIYSEKTCAFGFAVHLLLSQSQTFPCQCSIFFLSPLQVFSFFSTSTFYFKFFLVEFCHFQGYNIQEMNTGRK